MHSSRFVVGIVLMVGMLAPCTTFAGDEDGSRLSAGAGSCDGAGALARVVGVSLSSEEMGEIAGALHIRGVRIRNRARRSRRSFRASNPRAVHCDIIARNRAESLGLDTDAGRGAGMDFNQMTVSQIYAGYGGGGTTTPRPGTAGYVFTAYGGGKSHLQVYDARGTGSNSYQRYSNASFPGTESTSRVGNSYRPNSVTGQRFVAVPRRSYQTVWYR